MPYGPDSDAFVDTFDGAGAETNLESWTPTGGGSWTLESGAAGNIVVKTTGAVGPKNTAHYVCTDQGSSDHYIIFRPYTTASVANSVACIRLLDTQNFIGVKCDSSTKSLVKRVGNIQTVLSSESSLSLEWIKVEAIGTTIRWFKGGNGSTPSAWTKIESDFTVSDFQSETSQGLFSSNLSAPDWIDYFEAGAMPQPLALSPLLQSQSIISISLTQHSVISGANLSQAQTLSSPNVGPLIPVYPNNLLQSQNLQDGSVAPKFSVSGANLSQAQTIGTGSFTQKHLLSPASLNQAVSIGASSLTFLQYVGSNSQIGQIIRFKCYHNGVELPITSMQIRKQITRGWYLQVVTHETVSAKSGDTLSIVGTLTNSNGSTYTSTIVDTEVSTTDVATGPTSKSLIITGEELGPLVVNKTRPLSTLTNERTFSGRRFIRAPIDIDINQGDHILFPDGKTLRVAMVTYFASAEQAFMEISE